MRIAENSKEYVKRYFKNLPQSEREKSTAKQAEEYIKSYFREIRNINLCDHEPGFDFRNASSTLFVEVKGSKKEFNQLQGWYFTEQQYKKAKSCQRNRRKYEIHIVVGIGSASPEHYMEDGENPLGQAKKSISWWLRRPEV
jgi:hypothetical protein